MLGKRLNFIYKDLVPEEEVVATLRPLASKADGRTLRFNGRDWPVEEARPEAFDGVDIALFSAGGSVSRDLAPEAAKRGVVVIDNSSQWRMDPSVPLVVAGVNDDDAAAHAGIIANPNCSTMQLMPVLMALRDAVGIERVIVDTYQAVSGTGHKAVAELEGQIAAHAAGQPKVATVYPHPIGFNALPHIDVFLENGARLYLDVEFTFGGCGRCPFANRHELACALVILMNLLKMNVSLVREKLCSDDNRHFVKFLLCTWGIGAVKSNI